MRLGTQFDAAGIDGDSEDADRAVRYLVKYLTKAIADSLGDHQGPDPARERHIDRLHDELQLLRNHIGPYLGGRSLDKINSQAGADVAKATS